jgi:hypothetical protein
MVGWLDVALGIEGALDPGGSRPDTGLRVERRFASRARPAADLRRVWGF